MSDYFYPISFLPQFQDCSQYAINSTLKGLCYYNNHIELISYGFYVFFIVIIFALINYAWRTQNE